MAGLYIHVPFCSKRCIYCDFFSNTDMGYKASYVETLVKEMGLRKDYLTDSVIETIYLGGGTPSQLSPRDLTYIFEGISEHFTVDSKAEITMEVNPDDLTDEYVKALVQLPFNRISMGIQSFHDKDLQFLNRRHSGKQAIEGVYNLQKNGFSNISIDLMYGLPGQSLTMWEENIQQALDLKVPHISAYHLIYEEDTALYKLKQKGQIDPVDEDTSLQAFELLITRLKEAGFVHYEISNFCLPEMISRHNSSYWKGVEYLGLGPSAHSYNRKQRDWNVASLPAYLKGIETGVPDIEGEILDLPTRYNDFIITGLRTMWGINLRQIEELYGETFSSYCREQAAPLVKKGLLNSSEGTLTLTGKGIFISDSIMSDLLFIK